MKLKNRSDPLNGIEGAGPYTPRGHVRGPARGAGGCLGRGTGRPVAGRLCCPPTPEAADQALVRQPSVRQPRPMLPYLNGFLDWERGRRDAYAEGTILANGGGDRPSAGPLLSDDGGRSGPMVPSGSKTFQRARTV